VADAREDVVQRTIGRLGEAHAVGGHDRNVERGGERQQRCVVRFLVAPEMPLQLDADALAPEDAHEPIDESADAVPRAVQRLASRERDEPRRVPFELVEIERALPFRRAQLHAREETTEIVVTLRAFDEEGETPQG
jgi:hypothetical protein